MSQYYRLPALSITASNPSVGTNGAVAPTSSTLVAGINPSNNQNPLQVDTNQNLKVTTPDVIGNGTITANGQTVSITNYSGASSWSVQLTGTFSAGSTVNFEVSDDNVSWIGVNGRQTGTGNGVAILSSSATGPGPLTYRGNLAGTTSFRVRCSAFQVSDSITVAIHSSTGPGAVFLNSAIPGGVNTIGGVNLVDSAGTNKGTIKAASTAAASTDPALVVALSPNNNTLANALFEKITDGTNTAAVKAASTAPVATDPALVVTLSPNTPVTTGSATSALQSSTQGSVGAGTAATASTLTGGIFNSSFPSLTNGQQSAVQLDSNGRQIVSQGASAVASSAWVFRVTDGTTIASVKAASTAPVATDAAAVVAISPNTPALARQTGTFTDRSGTTSATPSTSTTLMASNASRKYMLIVNSSTTNTIWINFTTAAVATQPSIPISPLGSFVMESGFVSTEAVTVLCTVASSVYSAKEG